MPRKQLDIVYDLCRAHREQDEARYQAAAQEFVRYLRWKGFQRKAQEFEELFQSPLPDSGTHPHPLPGGEQKGGGAPEGESGAGPQQGALFETAASQPRQATNAQAAHPAWQISQGAEINLLQAQRVLQAMFQAPGKGYSSKDFAAILGYALKKTEGFLRWLGYLGLTAGQPKQPTALARLVQTYDPYFEDAGTLWFLHYGVSSQPHLVIWHRIANQLLLRPQFTLEDAKALFSDQAARHTPNAFRTHLRKEFLVCTRAYLEAEFSRLHLLEVERDAGGAEVYRRTLAAPAPDEIALAAILLYRARYAPNSAALEIPRLIFPENAPGRLLFLKEPQFRAALERLRLNGWITIESFADLDQIKFVRTSAYLECLQSYYQAKLGQG